MSLFEPAVFRVDAIEGCEEKVGRAVPAAFQKFEDAAGIVDFLAIGDPVPDAFVGGSKGEFQPFEFDGVAIFRSFPVVIHTGVILRIDVAGRKDDFEIFGGRSCGKRGGMLASWRDAGIGK